MKYTRDIRIDALRALAILMIIVAHAFPGDPRSVNLMYSLREFDVPAMAFLLGASFVISFERKRGTFSYRKYVWSRFKRLVIPTWVFATIVFVSFYVFSLLLQKPFPYSWSRILSTYYVGKWHWLRVDNTGVFYNCFGFTTVY